MAETQLSNVLAFEKPKGRRVLDLPEGCMAPRVPFDFPVQYPLQEDDDDTHHYQAFLDGLRAFYLLIAAWNSDSGKDTPELPANGLRLWVAALRAQYMELTERGNEFDGLVQGRVGYCGVANGLAVLESVLKNYDSGMVGCGYDLGWIAERLEEHRLQILAWLKELEADRNQN
ncbi:hypothetical protein SAMN06295888_10288 [Desulfonatronum zhilinae]|nr:hypothetical protein SAMN06295888_10288 [Desulfonatronum zhilinae]